MNNYEILYIIKNDLEDDAKAAVVDKYSALVEKLGGSVDSVDKWGTKKFAYTIDFKNEGYYVLMNFKADAAAPAEIDRLMNIDDAVMRHMVVRK